MEKLILSPRLRQITELVRPGSVLADVGTDHGYVPVWLLKNGVIPRAVATDLNRGPLSRAETVAEQYGVRAQLRLVLCDGLRDVAAHEVDTVVIAGMGGETMIGILNAAPWTKENTELILQPQSKLPELREWLYTQDYFITGEYLVRDAGKLYTIFTAQGGTAPLPERTFLYCGVPELHHNVENLCDYLKSESSKLMELASRLTNSGREADRQRREEYLEVAAGMHTLYEKLRKESI